MSDRMEEIKGRIERVQMGWGRPEILADDIRWLLARITQLERANELLSSAYAHMQSGQGAKAERLRDAARSVLSAEPQGTG